MSCELDKVISIINEVANGIKNPVALKELNELKSDLTQFSVSMQSTNEVKDVSKLLDTLTRVSKSTGSTSTKDTPVLNSLPSYVVGQRNMTYAGVGSRETPPEILAEMTKIAQELAAKKYSLQSGGAIGADMAFEGKSYPKVLKAGNADVLNKSGKVVLKANTEVRIGTKEYTDVYYVFTDRTNNGRVTGLDFTKAESIKGTKSYSAFDVKDKDVDKKAMAIAKELHPKFENLKSDFAKKLMARNNFQVFGSNLDKPVDFVLFYAKESKNPLRPEGGTGQAVEAARRKGIPTINMSEEGWRDKLNDVLEGKVQNTETESKSTKNELNSNKESKTDEYITSMLSKINPTLKIEEDKNLFKKYLDGVVTGFAHYSSTENKIVLPVLPEINDSNRLEYIGQDLYMKMGFKSRGSDHNYFQKRYGVLQEDKTYDMTKWFDKFLKDSPDSVIEYAEGYYTLETAKEIYEREIETGFFSKEGFERVIRHEKVHAYTSMFIRNNPEHKVTKSINKLYREAMLKMPKTGNPYWKKNIHEFVAEAISNPKVRDLLKVIPTEQVKNKISIFDRLVELLLESLGLKRGNIYSELLYALNNIPTDDIKTDKLIESKHLSKYKQNATINSNIIKILNGYDTDEYKNVVTTGKNGSRRALWFGDEDYQYSGVTHKATAMHPYVKKIAEDIEKETGVPVGYFNSVLINEYKDNKGLGAHPDNEPIFRDKDGNIGKIASLTLSGKGLVTIFDNKGKKVEEHSVSVGDLYVMPGEQFQDNFKHKVDTIGENNRISLTFRHIPLENIASESAVNLEPTKIEKVNEDETPIEKVEGLTSGQSKAFKEILEILDSDNEHSYLLEGPGGTGKSFVVGEILKEHLKGAGTRGEKVKVMATATAHAAKNIIGDFVEKSIKELDKADSSVIETTRAVTIQLPRTLKNMMSSKKVQPELIVVLDEVSMVSPLVIAGIQGYVKTINDSGIAKVKLVMLGDRAQLRPVFTPKNPNKIELTPYTNRATGNKYVYIEGIAFDIKNSNGAVTLDGVPADVISGTMIDDKMVITNLDSLKLKSSLFRNTSSVRGTTLLENMRNPKLAEMFDKFRTGDDRVLTTVAEEEDPKFTKQYTDARNELKQFKVNGEELVIDLATSSIQNNTKLLKSWIDGKTAVVAFTNQAVNDINSNMTRIAGKLVGKEQQVASFGLFEGQTLKSTANIINSYGKGNASTKLTNNTTVTISKLFKASTKTKYDTGHILPVFDGDLLHEIARDNFIEEENSLYVYGIRLNINKMPLAEQANINMANVTFTDPEDRKVQRGSTIVTSSTESEIGKLLEEYGEFVQMTYMDGDLIEASAVPTKGIRLPNDVAPFVYNMELSKAEYGAVKPVYAMTAHKSQGTTLENVIVVEDWKPNRYLTEVAKLELMYVAVSRSAGKIVLAGEKIGRLLQQVESSEAVINTSLGTIRAIKAQGC